MALKLEKWLDVIQKMRLITKRETECKFYIQKVRVHGSQAGGGGKWQ